MAVGGMFASASKRARHRARPCAKRLRESSSLSVITVPVVHEMGEGSAPGFSMESMGAARG